VQGVHLVPNGRSACLFEVAPLLQCACRVLMTGVAGLWPGWSCWRGGCLVTRPARFLVVSRC
jgi:hypothetical protein